MKVLDARLPRITCEGNDNAKGCGSSLALEKGDVVRYPTEYCCICAVCGVRIHLGPEYAHLYERT